MKLEKLNFMDFSFCEREILFWSVSWLGGHNHDAKDFTSRYNYQTVREVFKE